MRRVKLIPLAMAAVLAGAINMAGTGHKAPESARSETRKLTGRSVAAVGDAEEPALARLFGLRPSALADGLKLAMAATPSTTLAPTTTTAPPPTLPPTTTTAPPPPPPAPPSVDFLCPVQGGGLNFVDTWGMARSGGRTHQGTDMLAEYGTPTVAPVSGRVEHRSVSMGGLAWFLYGDNGDMYYGAHLSDYENVGAGWVAQGTVIGYVGMSGNAAGTTPHLHFEIHPGGGSAVNPYSTVSASC